MSRHTAPRRALPALFAVLAGQAVGFVAPAFIAPASAGEPAGMSIKADGDAMQWRPAPAILPKGVMIALLSGDPDKQGPFTLRLTLPANTVIAPHTHAQDESVTVISGDFYHGHEDVIDRSKGVAVHTGGFVFLPANHVHSLWTDGEPAVIQVTGTGPFGVHYIRASDDPSKGHS